jgi:hypothetical protein
VAAVAQHTSHDRRLILGTRGILAEIRVIRRDGPGQDHDPYQALKFKHGKTAAPRSDPSFWLPPLHEGW